MRYVFQRLLLAVWATLACAAPALAHEGDLDPSFARGSPYSPGRLAIAPIIAGSQDDTAYAVAIQSDGKILVAGRAGGTGISGAMSVVRLWQDGTVDTSFGNTGRGAYVLPVGNSYAKAIALAANGDILLGGSIGNQGIIVAVLPDGSAVDTTFGNTGSGVGVTLVNVNGDTTHATSISDLKLNPFGTIYVTGNYNGSGHQQMMLGLVAPGGALLKTEANDLGGGGGLGFVDQFASALAIQPDGKLVVAGYAWSSVIHAFTSLVARHNVTLDGSGWHFPLDATYPAGGVAVYYSGSVPPSSFFYDALTLLPGGYAVAAGRTSNPTTGIFDSALASRLDTGGQMVSVLTQTVTPFDGNSIRTALPDAYGKLVFTGFSGWNDGQGDSGSGFFAMRTSATGLYPIDPSFGNAGIRFFTFDDRNDSNDQSFGAALDRYGRVVLVGFTQYGQTNPNYPVMAVARLTSDLIFASGFELHE